MIELTPSKLIGTVKVPSSKSLNHRAIICAALANGQSKIENISLSDDINTTINCLKSIGVNISVDNACATVTGNNCFNNNVKLDCNQSGSTLRFMLPIIAALGISAEFTGSGRLPDRPIKSLIKQLSDNGCTFSSPKLPFVLSGKLRSGNFNTELNETSQFLSGLLMALPIIGNGSKIYCEDYHNNPYVELTIDILKNFGVNICYNGDYFYIPDNSHYSPAIIKSEGDWSAGAFYHCANALGSDIKINGLSDNSIQGDKAVIGILDDIKSNDNITIDAKNIPDIVPLLAVTLTGLKKNAVISNIGKLRLKESDRISSVVNMIRAIGGNISADESNMYIHPAALNSAVIDCFNDHRITMAASLISVFSDFNITLINENVSKSYPEFFNDFYSLKKEVF